MLVTGESGAGKERIASAMHTAHGQGPFVAINCAAIPRDLLEAELFGAEKGVFTGAVKSRAGLVEQADGGTLFLDEISEMDLFWTNRGGYSVAFRQWILYPFYPTFILLAPILGYLSFNMGRYAKTIRRHPISSLLPTCLAWLFMAATGVVVIIDNLEALFKGVPLHTG